MKALVTGASGFIGSHLCPFLAEHGWDVVALARRARGLDPLVEPRIRRVTADLLDPASIAPLVEEVDVVFHLAGLTKALRRADLFATNALATKNLLAACARRSSPPTMVQVSSLAAAGPWHGRPRSETDPLEPVSMYGRSKREGELHAEAFADRMPITVVRPPIVFGERDAGTLPMFQAVYWLRTHVVPGIMPQRFSLIHVADLVPILVAATQGERLPAEPSSTGGSGYYFADSGEHPTYGEIGQLIGAAMGRRWTLPLPVPAPFVRSLALVGELKGRLLRQAAPLNWDKAREATAGSWWCSGEKGRRDLGVGVASPLAERFTQTVAWYREHGWLGGRPRTGTKAI